MRLIDVDELRQRFIKRIQPLIGKDNSNERHEYMSWLRSVHLLGDMPTVEIVRCKDCKYSKSSVISDRWVCTTYSLPGDLKADDFCSRGERKDE